MELDLSAMGVTMNAIGAELRDYQLPRTRRPRLRRVTMLCPNVVWAEGNLYRCGTRIGHDEEQELLLCWPCQEIVQELV